MNIKNLYKLLIITFLSVIIKNLLQILFATSFKSAGELRFYNLNQENVYSFKFILFNIILYDFILLFLFYIIMYLILFFVVKDFGNKIWIQILYISIIYLLAMLIKEHGNFYFEYVIISILIGFSNWLMFKKWIN